MILSLLTLKKQTAEHVKSAENMVKNVMKAFETSDVELEKTTAAEDDKVDDLFSMVWHELIEMMIEDPTIINNASHLLFVLRYLERIGEPCQQHLRKRCVYGHR